MHATLVIVVSSRLSLTLIHLGDLLLGGCRLLRLVLLDLLLALSVLTHLFALSLLSLTFLQKTISSLPVKTVCDDSRLATLLSLAKNLATDLTHTSLFLLFLLV